MSSIPLRIILHGLIALVPTTDSDGHHHMTALLVDGRTSHSIEAKCASTHHPMLKFLVAQVAECTDAKCEFSNNQCTCKETALAGKHISIEVTPSPALASQRPSNSSPLNSLPTTSNEAASFSYVANLSHAPFGLSLNPEYLNSSPPAHLLARMTVPFNEITSCALAAREDGGESYVYEMSFRELHAPSLRTDTSQALAQRVITQIMVPEGAQEEQKVVLHIKNFGDLETAGHKITLLPGGSGYRIEISNQPLKPLLRDDPCNDGVARHFAMFYDLAQDPPDLPLRLLPHVRFGPSKTAESIRPEICDEPSFALMDRPICPMATFNP